MRGFRDWLADLDDGTAHFVIGGISTLAGIIVAMATFVLLCAMLGLTGCAVMPDKLLIGADHTSHILQHFEREGYGDQTGCTGPMLGLRWEGKHYYLQASDMYCAQGRNDLQHEVANVQAGIAVDLK